ncbi:hypothetical protein AOLI_G00063290 [Acnodon oligacanthus]
MALEDPDLTCSQEEASNISVKVGESSSSPNQKEKLHSLLGNFQGLFTGRLGDTSLAEHRIETGDTKPINLPPYHTSPLKKKLIEEQIQIMLEKDIIELASGPWAAPVVIVPKASGEPRVDKSLDFLARGKFISTIDLARGYWQVGVEESSRMQKTAFASHCALFQFKVLPFGLCNSPATFQRLMNTVLAGLVYKCCAVYLDDVVIASPTFKQHLLDLGQVFSRLESAGLSLKLGKCQLCLDELKFLGYGVTPHGILPDMDKVKAMTAFPVPIDVRQVRQFLGLTSYYRRFIGGYAQQAKPLFGLTCQRGHYTGFCKQISE